MASSELSPSIGSNREDWEGGRANYERGKYITSHLNTYTNVNVVRVHVHISPWSLEGQHKYSSQTVGIS